MDEDQYAQIMRNHGPPPSYEIAVAMKKSMTSEKCHLCQKKVCANCSCDSRTTAKEDEDDFEKTCDTTMQSASDQLLNVKNISRYHRSSQFCKSVEQRNMAETCEMCDDEELPCKNDNLCDEDIQNGNIQDDGYCQCTNTCNCVENCGVCGKDIHGVPDTSNGHDINDNVPSTSGDGNFCQNGDINCNNEESDDGETEFDSLNENGLIRVDMRKIIDETGLPTYEAALKLESSGYV